MKEDTKTVIVIISSLLILCLIGILIVFATQQIENRYILPKYNKFCKNEGYDYADEVTLNKIHCSFYDPAEFNIEDIP